MNDEPRNIFTARSAKAVSWSYPSDGYTAEDIVTTVKRCGCQERFVGLEGPKPGDEGWALTPDEARRLARELLMVADEVADDR